MSLESLVNSKIAVYAGVLFLVYATAEFSSRANESLSELPVLVPNKIAAPAKAKKKDVANKSSPVYQLLVTPAAQQASPPLVKAPEAQLDRLFALDTKKAQQEGNGASGNPALQLPVPGGAGASLPPGVPAGAAGGQAESATRAGPPPNLFRVDGIANDGAFITGRYFKTGAELEGVALPVVLAPGEKAILGPVSVESVTIMLGNRSIVLTKPKE